MNADQTFRLILIAGSLIFFPVALYHRLKSRTGERLDRWKEGPLILFTLRPIGIGVLIGFFTYLVNPAPMAWSSMPLPVWLRWLGVGIAVIGGALFVWALRNLGKNLTDSLAAANWFLLGGGVVVFALLAIRTPIEEAQLLARFDGASETYMHRTHRFLPRR